MMASKEQVESLGEFLTVEGSENLETEGGYAKEAQMNLKEARRLTFRNIKKNRYNNLYCISVRKLQK